MGNHCISPDLKETALCLWEVGWEPSDLCSVLAVSQASLYCWHKIFEEFGDITHPPMAICGHPRIIGMLALQACQDIYARHPETYLYELQWYLAIKHNIPISTAALQNTLEAVGLTRNVLHKIAAERDEQLRQNFHIGIKNPRYFTGSASEFVTVDESSKNELEIQWRYGRAPVGQNADIQDVFVRGIRYSLVVAMSVKGYVATQVIEGSYDPMEFVDFIVEDVVPHMNAFPNDQSVLVMDKCQIHHDELLKETLEAEGIMLLYLPPYSPDLNPVEESFSMWKAYLRANNVLLRGSNDPVLALLDSCGCVTEEMAVAWFKHAGYIFEIDEH